MKLKYTNEKNIQIVIALLKAHGIRRVIASPGATNVCFVWSVQNDPYFEVYSAVDERHASYLACGMSAEAQEPVVISCTGATASRNWLSALTEAYYRKLPILAITSSQPISHLGNLYPQMTDRTHPIPDTVKYSVQLPLPRDERDVRDCEMKVNKAILELSRHGGGPVHINLETEYSTDYSANELPDVCKLVRVMPYDEAWPEIPRGLKIAVWIGAHVKFSKRQAVALENFISTHNAVVLSDQTGGYEGRGRVASALLAIQDLPMNPKLMHLMPDLIIHIGEISGDYNTWGALYDQDIESWRVNSDGEFRDWIGNLSTVFEMPEEIFFEHYLNGGEVNSYFPAWQSADSDLRKNLPNIPFSNIWIAQQLSPCLPKGARVHFGILNSLRSWNYFMQEEANGSCNTGGFGIDGCVSSLIGASLVHPEKLYFGVFGDLAFFYDLNSIGNRHCGRNLRILVVNNGVGGEFSLYRNLGMTLGPEINKFIGAEKHFANKSRELLKHYATDLGFKYLAASDKKSFESVKDEFLSQDSDKPIVFECFTDIEDDNKALFDFDHICRPKMNMSIRTRVAGILPSRLKATLKKVVR